MRKENESLSMNLREWGWFFAYCVVTGVPSLLAMTRPTIGIPLGIVSGAVFFRKLQKQ